MARTGLWFGLRPPVASVLGFLLQLLARLTHGDERLRDLLRGAFDALEVLVRDEALRRVRLRRRRLLSLLREDEICPTLVTFPGFGVGDFCVRDDGSAPDVARAPASAMASTSSPPSAGPCWASCGSCRAQME